MVSGRSNLVDVECELVHETERAILVYNGKVKVWLPKSVAEFEDGIVTLPEKFAIEKELI
jgi:hypothetical protein